MGEITKIGWTDHTFNPWIGCTKVSPGCLNCYAETQDNFRSWTAQGWGKGRPRKRTSPATWGNPLKWNAAAQRDDVRRRVFCASLADVFDEEVPDQWRDDLFDDVISKCDYLDWLILTKRPAKALNVFITDGWDLPNVWIGVSAEDHDRWCLRIPFLERIPAAVRFVSAEPLIGPIGPSSCLAGWMPDWVIVGGESGKGARPMDPEWARKLHWHCQNSGCGAAFFMKQMGGVRDKRDRFEDIPEDLRVREFPIPMPMKEKL